MGGLDLIVKMLIRPTSVWFVIGGLSVGLGLLYRKSTAVWGRRWLTAFLIVYWVLGTPYGAEWFARPLTSRYAPIADGRELEPAKLIVVLSGGTAAYRAGSESLDLPSEVSALRALEAARLLRLMGDPTVIASGGVVDPSVQNKPEGEVIRDALLRLGVPPARVVVEAGSRSTIEHARRLKELPQLSHGEPFVLVTSPTHMWRAVATLKTHGLRPIPAVAAAQSERRTARRAFLPDAAAMRLSDAAAYEYFAAAYYWSRGWLTAR